MKIPLVTLLLVLSALPTTTAAPADPGAPEGGSLARAVALAKEGTRLQALRLGIDLDAAPVPDVRHEGPSEAAFALLARHGAVADEGQAARLRALDGLPDAQRVALTRVLDAFLAFEDSTRLVYAAGVEAPDFAPGIVARGRLLEAAILLEEAFPPRATSGVVCGLVVPPALALDLEGCDNTYADPAALSIDVGGADTYLNNAGGNHLGAGDDCDPLWRARAAALLDFGGNDRYLSQGQCAGRNGGGAIGQGFLLDAAGDDLYVSNASAANGGGYLGGSGFLLDAGGSDAFQGGSSGVNGGGFLAGIGLLVDAGGHDAYDALGWGANGGGSFYGSGLLLDGSGNDRYTARDDGVNGGANGGTGALLDLAGDDVYEACCDFVNGGAQSGVGLLLDAGGSDSYREGAVEPTRDETRVKGNGAQVDVHPLASNPALRVDADGTCTLYNDMDRDGAADPGEALVRVPCRADPTVEQGADGRCRVYNDTDGDGTRDASDEPGTAVSCPAASGPVPILVPAFGHSGSVPALSTPGVPARNVTTPPVGTPATCTASACAAPTVLPATQTPPLGETCVQPILCIGPVAPQPLTPPVTVPPLCALAPLCLPPVTLVESQTVGVPGASSVPLTRPVTVSVASTGFAGEVAPNPGESRTVGPIVLQVGPVPVTLCPSGCVVPAGPHATLAGSVTVTVVVEGQTFTQTVPVSL